MGSSQELLLDIEAFLAETGMGPTYFGKRACGNASLVPRLRDGKSVQLETAEKVRDFIASTPVKGREVAG
jgi:hypothetical protein